MNDKIYELAKQADLIEFDSIPGSKAMTPSYESIVKARKFAELIVKDVRWVMQTAADDFILDQNYDAVKGVGRCMRRVKQHFGVEE